MSCTYSKGVVFCQTDPIGAVAVVIAVLLLVTVAYLYGRNRLLAGRAAALSGALSRLR